jgi:hypothetical protein
MALASLALVMALAGAGARYGAGMEALALVMALALAGWRALVGWRSLWRRSLALYGVARYGVARWLALQYGSAGVAWRSFGCVASLAVRWRWRCSLRCSFGVAPVWKRWRSLWRWRRWRLLVAQCKR